MIFGLALLGLSVAVQIFFWWRSERLQNANSVDFLWVVWVTAWAALGLILSRGEVGHRVLAGVLFSIWAFRLGSHLFYDRVRDLKEDGRYRALRAHLGPKAPRGFLVLFVAQALIAPFFAFSVVLMGFLEHTLGFWDLLAVALGLWALSQEARADFQLAEFRRHVGNRGRVCRSGWWFYSRHPNYFFQWLFWWSFVLLALPEALVLAALAGPLLMGFFLFRLTGIPFVEKQALRSRGDDYREYQRTTSVFFPLRPKV